MHYNVSGNTVKSKLKSIIEQTHDSVCGIEIKVKSENINYTLITPSFIRLDKYSHKLTKYPMLNNYTLYEGCLYRPFFLPIYDNLDGEFIEQLECMLSPTLKNDESIYMQWLFTKAYNWQDTAIDMYSSYILGNDQPLPIKIARKFQNGTLRFFSKFGASMVTRDYIEEAEQKIISEGFRFQLRVGINSSDDRQEFLVSKIEELFSQYDYYNTIRLTKIDRREHISHIQDCVMTSDKYQILSKREILSLFGGNDLERVEEIIEIQNESEVNSAIELLPDYPLQEVVEREGILQDIAEALKRVGITQQARVYNGTVTTGVRLTTIQFDIPKGKLLTDITKKQKDIQAALGVESLSIEQGDEPDTVKLSIPNEEQTIVGLRSLLENKSFIEFSKENPLAFVVGVDEINNPIYLSLPKLVHLMIAGSSGSGKSVNLNCISVTLMLNHSPQELRVIMIDPKLVEMQHFVDFPHIDGVITDMDKAVLTLESLTDEMDERYETLKQAGVKNINLYNDKVKNKSEIMPYKVVIIDEYADLKDTNPEVEDFITRLSQKARACGIHLIVATQRPSADIISGRIKANIPNAISFNLSNSNNYKTIFGKGIPYNLLNRGDGVLRDASSIKEFQRFQSPIISPDEREEENVYKKLSEYLNKKYKNSIPKDNIVDDLDIKEESEQADENLINLKKIIATTGETRTTILREKLGVKNTTLSELMKQLVAENWLELGRSKSEGYKLVASEETLEEWRDLKIKN